MNESKSEQEKCPKCQSLNLPTASYCRFCHERFNQSKMFVERKAKRKLRGKLIIAGGLVTAAAGYIFKRRKSERKMKKAA